MDTTEARRFLARAAAGALVLLAAIVALNVAMDPYGLFARPRTLVGGCTGGFRAGGVDARQLAVERSVPQVVLVGNSRVLSGHDTADPALKALGSPAFNFAWSAAAFDNISGRLSQIGERRPPRAVLVGVGIGDLVAQPQPDTTGSRSAPRWRVVVGGLIGATAAAASLRALASPRACGDPQQGLRGDASTSLGKPHPPPYPARIIRLVDESLARSYAHSAARWRESPAAAPDALAGFSRLVRQACARGTRVVAFFEPVHVRLLEIVWQSGAWEAMEASRRAAAREVDAARAAGCDAQLWDFVEYHAYTSGAHTDTPLYFGESSHYTPLLGRILTRRMLGPESAGDFGRRVDARAIDARSPELRAERARYVERHPAIAAYARELLDAVPPRAVRLRGTPPPN